MENGEPSILATHVVIVEAPPAYTIFWVDQPIRDGDRNGYKPDRVCIGPFYWDPSHWMMQVKETRLHSALCQQQAELLCARLARHEVDARGHYNMLFSRIASDEFMRMLLLDGYFVLSHFGLRSQTTDWETRPREYDRDVIFLLENQVPFFILEEIYKLFVLDPAPNSSLGDCDNSIVLTTIANCIKTLLLKDHYVHSSVSLNMGDGHRPCHLVHLLYKYFQPANLGSDQTSEDKATTTVPPPHWHSATYYHAAGVRLAVRELDGTEARSILDVKLKNGTLQVPCLVVHINTLTMLRNMVALEQYSSSIGGSHVATYCYFMAQMANTEEDVRLLSSKGIIVHHLCSDKDVADGLADLCRGVRINLYHPKYNYLRPIMGDLEKLCKSRWGKSWAWLLHNKCNNILMTLAVVAGVIIFLCTVEQSIISALDYANKKP